MRLILITILSIPLLITSAFAVVNEGDKFIKVCAYDEAQNIGNCEVGQLVYDPVAPIITFTNNPNSDWVDTPKIVTATITDAYLLSSKYAVIDELALCNSWVTFSDYASWTSLIFDNESFNWKKVCFEAVDNINPAVYSVSNIIEHIDTLTPADPSIILADQISYNQIRLQGSLENEDNLELIVKDNWVEIHREALLNPPVFDYTYTLDNSTLEHVITYHVEDIIGHSTSINTFTASTPADSSWYISWLPDSTEVWPVFTVRWTVWGTNLVVKIKDITTWEYIATWISDSLWNFIIETSTSQILGSMDIQLEVDWILVWDVRTITIVESDLKTPIITNTEELEKSNTKLPTIEIQWQALSNVQVYAKSATDDIIEIWRSDLDASWNASITSNITLPGWDNIIYVFDTIHKVSSQLLYITVIDPYGTCYDSVTKQTIPGCVVTVINCDTEATIVLPNLNWNPQDNPMTADANWYYSSYENVWNYCLKAEKIGYTWPSVIIASWTPNLDLTANVWSHGQLFSVIDDPIHIDIPMDIISNPVVSSGWGGWGVVSTIGINDAVQKVTSEDWKKITINYPDWFKVLTKTYNKNFNWGFYLENGFRFLYHKSPDSNKEIKFNKKVSVSITHVDYSWEELYIKYNDDEKYELFEDYTVNGKTITFDTYKWFLLYLDLGNKFKEARLKWKVLGNEWIVGELSNLKYPKYNVDKYDVNKSQYRVFANKLLKKHWKKLMAIPDDKVFTLFPVLFEKLTYKTGKKKITGGQKFIYNLLADIYEYKYSLYLKWLLEG